MNLEQYSQPLKRDETALRTLLTLNPRDSKKGRLFMPVYDARFPPTPEFSHLPFVYVSQFLEKNNASGNHYHQRKREVLTPLHGTFEFHFENIETKEKTTFTIDASTEYKAVIVPLLVSHRIVSLGDTGSLLVLASTPSSLDDEIEYRVE